MGGTPPPPVPTANPLTSLHYVLSLLQLSRPPFYTQREILDNVLFTIVEMSVEINMGTNKRHKGELCFVCVYISDIYPLRFVYISDIYIHKQRQGGFPEILDTLEIQHCFSPGFCFYSNSAPHSARVVY